MRAWAIVGAFLLVGYGCAAPTDAGEGGQETDEVVAGKRDPLAMPKAIRDYQDKLGWGHHHVEWHTVRQWDLLAKRYPDAITWAESQGWKRETLQEGTAGNGLAFLAMHRVMLRTMTKQFPKHAALFAGWDAVPGDPEDKANPVLDGSELSADQQAALARLSDDDELRKFADDDAFGLYLETKARPTKRDVLARTKDATAGLHNSLHNRFSNPDSPTNLGDPEVNMKNKLFWRLHGWLDARWTAFREAKGLREDEPAYKAEIAKWETHMAHLGHMRATPTNEPRPEIIGELFTLDSE